MKGFIPPILFAWALAGVFVVFFPEFWQMALHFCWIVFAGALICGPTFAREER